MGQEDQTDFVKEQYRSEANLAVRIRTHEQYGVPQIDFPGWVLELVEWRGDERVVDVGCGAGVYAAAARSRSRRYLAGDLSPGMLRSLTAPALLRANLDAQQLPLANNSVDVLLANHMLYHVPQIDLALREFARVLAPSGRLIAATNSRDNMAELHALGREVLVDLGSSAPELRPTLSFTLENGRQLLQPFFDHVERHDLPGALIFPEAQPVVDYLASNRSLLQRLLPPGIRWQDLIALLRQRVEQEISRNGGFRVNKLTGAFVCWNNS